MEKIVSEVSGSQRHSPFNKMAAIGIIHFSMVGFMWGTRAFFGGWGTLRKG